MLIQGDATAEDRIVSDMSSVPDLAALLETLTVRQPAGALMSSRVGRRLFWAYYVRILIYVTPRRALYWPTRDFTAEPVELDVHEVAWTEAAKAMADFPEAVMTAVDADGYPFSVRVSASDYDATTGQLPVAIPDGLHPVEGPASPMCHSHDEKMWNLRAVHVYGIFEKHDETWIFVSKAFTPPPRFGMMAFMRNLHNSAQKYLARRGLQRPGVNWAVIEDIKQRAAAKR